jgi:hypothetical protein
MQYTEQNHMKKLNIEYKKLLSRISSQVIEDLSQKMNDPWIKWQPVKVLRTDTFGWCSEIIKFKNVPGSIQLWLCRITNVNRPTLAVCYYHGNLSRVTEFAEVYTKRTKIMPQYTQKELQYIGDDKILAKPLPLKMFNKPVLESYNTTNTSFLTIFLDDEIKLRVIPSTELIDKITGISGKLVGAMTAMQVKKNGLDDDTVAPENNPHLAEHMRRERSPKLARKAKLRDGYICQVCGFNFANIYGNWGRGIAEAHHKAPLAKRKQKKVVTKVKDLITVCANCHRVLHRMNGKPNDIAILQRHLKRA